MDALRFGSAYKVKVNLQSAGSLAGKNDLFNASERIKNEFKKNAGGDCGARFYADDLFVFAVPDRQDAAFEQYLADAWDALAPGRFAKKDGTPVTIDLLKNSRYDIENGWDCAAAVEQAFDVQRESR